MCTHNFAALFFNRCYSGLRSFTYLNVNFRLKPSFSLKGKRQVVKEVTLKHASRNTKTFLNYQNEPVTYLHTHFTSSPQWRPIISVHSWSLRRITEALLIAKYCPVLNKQVQAFTLFLFPMGIA